MSNNIRNQPMYWRSGDPSTENEPTLLYPGALGSKVTAVDKTDGYSKTHQYVGTDSTMTTAPYDGATAWWSNVLGSIVTTDPTKLGRGRVAGVFRASVTPGNYCGIQTGGRHSAVKIIDVPTAAPSAAGLIVIPSATAGKADVLAAGSAATYPSMGRTAGAVVGGTSACAVDLDVPEIP